MALLLLTFFVAFALALRILVHIHYTGDHGIRLAKKGRPYIESVPGTVFVLSFLISGIMIVVNHFQGSPITGLFSGWANYAVGFLGLSGVSITVISQMQMGKSWRIGVDQNEQTELMMGGLYSKSRNPIYFGILLYWIALALSFAHPAMWACAVACWSCIELIVRKVEEPYLRRVHGETFETYVRGTNRYLIL